MKTLSRYLFLMGLPLLMACQKSDEAVVVRMGQEDVGNPVVQAADGSGYSVKCLRSIAKQIATSGKAAIDTCQVNLTAGSATAEQSATRGKFFTSNYSWVYYPPTYCNPSSYTYNYPSSYSPYNDTSYNNNSFCSFLFGGSYNYNCYYLFGYTNPSSNYGSSNYAGSNYGSSNYASSYNSSCDSCLYSSHPQQCLNRCYRSYYY